MGNQNISSNFLTTMVLTPSLNSRQEEFDDMVI